MTVPLIVVAHGTASPAGSATTARLIDAVRGARPDVPVDLCFLDVADPRLPDTLARRGDAPAVVVPVLLSTGYHVQSDIPAAVARYPSTRVARHLGPDPLLVDVLVERLGPIGTRDPVVLAGAGSSRAEAAAELAETARLLGARLGGRAVPVVTLGEDVRAALTPMPGPVRVATYLLAEGQFVTTLRDAVDGLGTAAGPLGVHPALVELVWRRYDDAAAPSG